MTKFVGTLGTTERVLPDGRVIEPGVEFEIDKEDEQDPHVKRLVEDGQIIKVEQTQQKKSKDKESSQ
jgi:invasion protein IalB